MDKKLEKIIDLTLDNSERTAERHGLIQYNYGQILRIHGLDLPPAAEIQFSYREKGGTTENRVGTTKDGVTEVQIPDKMLKNNGTTQDYAIWVFVYVTDETSGNTVYRIKLYVDSRPAPGEISEDPDEPHLLDEAVNAVNAAAERAETAQGEAENSAAEAKLKLEEIKRTADDLTENVGKAEDLDKALTGKLEQGEEIVENIKDKITAPPSPEVGKILKIKSVNADGTFVCEWADEPGGDVTDVRVAGKSVLKNGVAEIPIGSKNTPGVIKIPDSWVMVDENNNIQLVGIKKTEIDDHVTGKPILMDTFAYAVKHSFLDEEWTGDEQFVVKAQMGIDVYDDILDETLEEDSTFDFNFVYELEYNDYPYRHLYIYIDQSNVDSPVVGNVYVYPHALADDPENDDAFCSYVSVTSSAASNIVIIWDSYFNVICRYAIVENSQSEYKGSNVTLKVWDNSITDGVNQEYAFEGIKSDTIFKAGTRIVIKGAY